MGHYLDFQLVHCLHQKMQVWVFGEQGIYLFEFLLEFTIIPLVSSFDCSIFFGYFQFIAIEKGHGPPKKGHFLIQPPSKGFKKWPNTETAKSHKGDSSSMTRECGTDLFSPYSRHRVFLDYTV